MEVKTELPIDGDDSRASASPKADCAATEANHDEQRGFADNDAMCDMSADSGTRCANVAWVGSITEVKPEQWQAGGVQAMAPRLADVVGAGADEAMKVLKKSPLEAPSEASTPSSFGSSRRTMS